MKLSPQLIDTDSGPAEVFVAGEGQALVVLHGRGFGSGWRSYAWLGEELPDHRVITVSRPGYGETPVRTAPTFEQQGRLVLSIADTLDIDRVVVLGASNGGPAALWAATEFPDRIAGLVLWCAIAAPLVNEKSAEDLETEVADDRLQESYEREMAVYSAAVKSAEIDEEAALASMTRTELDRFRRDSTIERSIRNYVESRLASPPGIEGVRNDTIQTQVDRTKSHQALKVPTLIMHGDSDSSVPATHAEFHHRLAGSAELVQFEGGGHGFFLTFRREVIDTLRKFLETCRTS